MTIIRRTWPVVLCAAMLTSWTWQGALACACCSATGERTDLVMPLGASYIQDLESLRFDKTAELFLGEADPEMVKGIATPSDKYDLHAAWQGNRLVLSFRDKAGKSGTLSLTRPATISIFYVDPRLEPRHHLGAGLYKEWRLKAKAEGSGVFTPGLGAGQTLTLVLQGRGNNCTSANDFAHWMLVMWGPKAKYHFFGDFVPTP